MQTEEQSKFRLTWQVAVVTAVLMIALALPVAMVMGAFRWQKKTASEPTANQVAEVSKPLEKALGEIVDKTLSSAEIEPVGSHIEITAADPKAESARLEKLVATLGGTGLPASDEGTHVRLTVMLPVDQVEAFKKACPQESLKATIQTSGETTLLVTVTINPKKT